MKRIPELDGLRGIAILLVIGCHYEVFARQLWGIPKYGWVGVDLFFALSGFLITSVLLDLRGQPGALRAFYARRIRRILPAYAAFLILLYLVTACVGDRTLYTRGTILRNLFFLQSFGNIADLLRTMISGKTLALAHNHLGPALAGLKGPVSNAWLVLWSLSIEEYYYLLWAPILLWMAGRKAAFTGILICGAALTTRWLGSTGSGAYYSIYHRFDAPVFGSFVAMLMASRLTRKSVNWILVLAGLLGATSLATILLPMGNILGREIRQDHRFMVFGVPSLLLLAAMVVGISVSTSGSSFLSPLRLRPLRFVGKISYMLYLLHGLVYLCFLQFFKPDWAVSLGSLSCSVALSWLSWKYFEQPILESGRKDRRNPSSDVALASVA